jgi:hypothetical protein
LLLLLFNFIEMLQEMKTENGLKADL